jgi:hypothetical protein
MGILKMPEGRMIAVEMSFPIYGIHNEPKEVANARRQCCPSCQGK